MANISISPYQGKCLPPFLDESLFPSRGGALGGRFCAPIYQLPGKPTCCLPCPATDWAYPDSFRTYGTVAEWLNVAGLVLMLFMLVSYTVLPAQKTRSHYLSVCLIVSVMLIALGFTVPLIAQPEQCHNAITPNDMYSSNECAWSGAFLVSGGLCATMWIFIRALSMNLQICWDIVPGKTFFYVSQAVGWGIPAVLLTAVMTVTGVSFRFGYACHINHQTSMQDFWGPLMGFAAAAGILQLMTFAYCIHVYLKNLWSDNTASSNSAGGSQHLPTYNASLRTQTARAVYSRLKKVLWLQWRGLVIISIILVDVILFSIVFVSLDGMQSSVLKDWRKVEPWLACLALHPTDKAACLSLVNAWLINEQTVVAALLLLSLTGIQVFLFLTRPEIFPAWSDFLRAKFFSSRQEFVSHDARSDVMRSSSKQQLMRKYDHVRGHQSTTFEMLQPQLGANGLLVDMESKDLASPTPTALSSPDEVYHSQLHHTRQPVGPDEAEYHGSSTSPNPWASGMLKESTMPPPQHATREAADHSGQQPMSSSAGANELTSPPSPVLSRSAISPYGQPSGYFTPLPSQQQQQEEPRQRLRHGQPGSPDAIGPSPIPTSSPRIGSNPSPNPNNPSQQTREQHRPYATPPMSFSARTPSRQSSRHSSTAIERHASSPPLGLEGYGRGGLGMNPPSEVGEDAEEEIGKGERLRDGERPEEEENARRQSQSVDSTRRGRD